jgi:hypothetical protein
LGGRIRRPSLALPITPDELKPERMSPLCGPPGRHSGGPGRSRHGSNPYFPPSSVLYKLLKPQSQEPHCSQESQAVCTKHVHELKVENGALASRRRLARRTAVHGARALRSGRPRCVESESQLEPDRGWKGRQWMAYKRPLPTCSISPASRRAYRVRGNTQSTVAKFSNRWDYRYNLIGSRYAL